MSAKPMNKSEGSEEPSWAFLELLLADTLFIFYVLFIVVSPLAKLADVPFSKTALIFLAGYLVIAAILTTIWGITVVKAAHERKLVERTQKLPKMIVRK